MFCAASFLSISFHCFHFPPLPLALEPLSFAFTTPLPSHHLLCQGSTHFVERVQPSHRIDHECHRQLYSSQYAVNSRLSIVGLRYQTWLYTPSFVAPFSEQKSWRTELVPFYKWTENIHSRITHPYVVSLVINSNVIPISGALISRRLGSASKTSKARTMISRASFKVQRLSTTW